jgi:SNF2 family DNA or RNA helicase
MNTITDETSAEAPIPFRGGILADHMGLGKTLSMIALIASDYDATGQSAMRPSLSSPSQVVDSVRATLIVVPRALLYTWDQQLKRHVGSTLKWLFYHGPKRSLSKEQLATNHIVLTTYQTVSSEWKRLDSSYGSLFSVYWNRIILDEAHVIRDRLTLCAQAICQLRAERRWAVSGTPIQNRLTDLSTILAFLQAYPYNDPKVFNEDISQLWKSGSEAAAADRLKKIIHCISLRRSSSTITLPKRTDEVHRLQFSRAERKEYDKIQANTLFHLNTASSVGTSAAKQFFHVLKQINSLRQICNLGLLAFSAAQVEDNSIDEFVDFG